MGLLFSIPVHADNNIVRLTIANLKQNVENCSVVLHVSEGFTDFDFKIGDIDNVYINPVRFLTKHGDSQFGIHLKNHQYAVELGVPYDTFCIMHTSEMFVKKGVNDLISQYDYSLWFDNNTMPRDMLWHPMVYALNNNVFADVVPDKSWYIGGLVEGMWISRSIMDQIFDWAIRVPARLNLLPGWTFEEVALPTLARWFGRDKAFCEPYNAFFNKDTEIADIDKVINGEPVELWITNCWNKTGIPHMSNGADKYSVKRLSRDINDPTRQHIIKLTGLDISAIVEQ